MGILSFTILRTHLLVLTMNSLRLFSRALPKASLRQSAIRYSSVSRFTARRPIWQPAMRTSYPAFSTSTFHREPAGDSDLELAEKLNSERQLELENNDESTVAAIDDFLKTHPWEVQDKPGLNDGPRAFNISFDSHISRLRLTPRDRGRVTSNHMTL